MRSGKAILLALAFSALLMMGAPARGVEIPLFSAEAQAQAHCPSDEVVWLNLPTGIYHIRGSRWYSATKSGAYVCRAEADRAGYRASRNG